MASIKDILSGIKKHYDRLLAGLVLLALLGSLLYLAIRVGAIKAEQRRFDDEIANMEPTHPAAKAVDAAAYDSAMQELENPRHIEHEAWTNELVMPGARVWCVACRNLIESNSEKCAYCGTANEKGPPPKEDTDGDGLPDKYEIKYGFDRLDREDAARDHDEDLYSTLVEYKEGTDPTNALSHRPYERELVVHQIEVVPFRLIFRSKIRVPGAPALKIPGVKDFMLPAGTEIGIPEGSKLTMPDGSTRAIEQRTSIRYLDVLDFAVIQRKITAITEGEKAGSTQEVEDELTKFSIFDNTVLALPEGAVLVIPGKKPFKMVKGAELKPVFGFRFGLNLSVKRRGKITTKTFFVREGEEVNRFKVIKFTPKKDGLKDVSELVLKKDDKIITLVFNKRNDQAEKIVHLRGKLPTEPLFKESLPESVKTFVYMENKYEVISVDIESQVVVIEREHDKKRFNLTRDIVEEEATREEGASPDEPETEPMPPEGE